MLELAVFNSHPTQHFAPWWQALGEDERIRVKVFYFSRANVETHYDPEFDFDLRYDVDLLSGYESEFLSRGWPFRNPTTPGWYRWNRGLDRAVTERRWHGVLIFGYNMVNNALVVRRCRMLGIPLLFYGDSNVRTAFDKPFWKLWIKAVFVRAFFRRIDAFLPIGDSNRDYLLHYGARADRMWWCPCPVDVGRLQRAVRNFSGPERAELRRRYGLTPDDFVVTFSGKLVERKRPLDLAEAVTATGDPKIKALFVGSGPLELRLRRAGGEQVRLTGFVNQQEIARVLALGDLAAMPSSYDAHPLAVTESLALGIPVLVSDRVGCHGPNDVLRDGENGLVYPSGDVGALAGAILGLKADADRRRRMGERARRLAGTQSPGVAAQAVVRCLRELRERQA